MSGNGCNDTTFPCGTEDHLRELMNDWRVSSDNGSDFGNGFPLQTAIRGPSILLAYIEDEVIERDLL